MAQVSMKKLRDKARTDFVEKLTELLENNGYEVLQVASNGISIPFVHDSGEEDYFKIVVSIPTGSKEEPFDGYEENKNYLIELVENQKKAEERKAKAEQKKKADAERRAKLKALKEKRETDK